MNTPFAIFDVAFAVALIAISLLVYGRLLHGVFASGGKVSVREFGLPDLFLVVFFAFWFVALAARGFTAGPRPVKTTDVYYGAAMFLVIVGGIVVFLRFRGIHPLRQFGLLRVWAPKAAALALGLLLAAYPALALASKVTELARGGERQPQEVVKFFAEAAAKSDHGAIALLLFFGVIVAPIAEEFLFRGYLYGVMKRYCGIAPAMILSAGLFAAIHLNAAALPALFLLALAFTTAYEMTGSILVNIFMHGLFNLTMFLLLLNLPAPLG